MTKLDKGKIKTILAKLQGDHKISNVMPSRDLDTEIFKLFNPQYEEFVPGRGGLVHPNDGADQRVLSDVRAPYYTSDIRAAIGMIPYEHPYGFSKGDWFWTHEHRDYESETHIGYENGDTAIIEDTGKAENDAMAICIAALKVRLQYAATS